MVMTKPAFDDETLMAFADGELDEATAAAVEDAVNHDDELMARVAMFMETRARAKAEMASLLDQPVPHKLEQDVRAMVEESRKASANDAEAEPGQVVQLGSVRKNHSARRAETWTLPLAASLVAAIAAGIVGYQLGSAGDPEEARVAGVTDPAVQKALQTLASGEERQLAGEERRIRIVSSFRDQDGTFCREYEIDPAQGSSLVAVSCHEASEWITKIAVTAPLGEDGYAPASSMEALEAYLSAINAGPALSEEEEAQALADLR
ncbi:anti-sigma factor family protein [Chelativorans salis]|uniref:Anti-sigma factor n=1 Tax=Chelativorans salis TaxID=2978478 RepID=A0ABT2LUT3_9HYPH|nr:anti-sigma factor [Chelativorans sp. EGI FJ00035]MCT7377849.1 anti-sigma factor [Chelativorans sp. EGI FJ00035]